MEKENIAVGLDIGTTKIVAMVGKKNEYGKIEILGVGKTKSLGLHRGVVVNIVQTTNSIKDAILQAESASGYKIKSVVVGIAGQHIRSMQHKDYLIRSKSDAEDVITEADIDQLVSQVEGLALLPGEEVIHVLPQEFTIDGQDGIKEPIGMSGSRIEADFHVVVGQASSIRNVARCVKDAGVELAGLTLEPLASSDSVLSQEEKEAGVALIDIGGGTTDLAIFKDGIIRHTAVVPFGGNVITEDIREGCTIIERQAESLKVRYGSAWPGENKDNEIVSIPGIRNNEAREITLKNLSLIIHARVMEIIEQVFQQIKEYGHEEPRRKLIAGIVLTGGGAQLKHIKQLVEYVTGMDTRIGFPNEHLAGNTKEDISNPLYATAVGLMIESLKDKTTSAVSKETLEEKKEIPSFQREELKPIMPIIVEEPFENETSEKFKQEKQIVKEEEEKKEEDNKRKKPLSKYLNISGYLTKIKDFLDNAE